MYAVVTAVDIHDTDAAISSLADGVVPMTKALPGFVSGVWVQLGASHGASIVVFETEEQAQAGIPPEDANPPGVTFTSVKVGEVAATA